MTASGVNVTVRLAAATYFMYQSQAAALGIRPTTYVTQILEGRDTALLQAIGELSRQVDELRSMLESKQMESVTIEQKPEVDNSALLELLFIMRASAKPEIVRLAHADLERLNLQPVKSLGRKNG